RQRNALAGRILDEQLDFARTHDIERFAGFTDLEQRIAGRKPAQVDDAGEVRAVVIVEVLEELDFGERPGIAGHGGVSADFARFYDETRFAHRARNDRAPQ